MRRRDMLLGLGALAACRRRGIPRDVAPAFDRNAPVAVDAAPVAEDEVPEADPDLYATLAGFCDGIDGPDAGEYMERQQRVKAAIPRSGLKAVVVEPGPNMSYLAGVRWGRSERPFLAVVRPGRNLAWVCPAFEERKAREQLGPDATVHTWREHEDPFRAVAKIAGPGRAPIGVDPEARGFIFEGTRKHVRAQVGAAPITGARLRKTPAELDRLRRVNEATKAALAVAMGRAVPPIKQSEFAAEVRRAQEAAGLVDVWALVLFGPAAAFPHGTDEDRALQEGELVLVDTGGALHGYRSDISRTWAVGKVGDAARKAWDTVAEAQAAALEQIRPGKRCGEPDAAARAVIAKAGYGEGYAAFTHRLGHGIGLQVHEEPYLRMDNPMRLEPGMTMSNEPGIYVPGELGVRLEDIVAVTDDQPEVFGPAAEAPD